MLTTPRIALLLALGLLTVAAPGCQSTDPPAARHENVSADAYPAVTATGGLDRFLAFDRAAVERTPSGAMTVSVPVRILRDRPVPVQYRFTFLDDRLRPLRPEMDWQFDTLPGRTQRFLTGTAMDERAVDWRLEIRPAHQP